MAASQQIAKISEKKRAILNDLKNEIKASSNEARNEVAQNQAAVTFMNMANVGVGKMIVHEKREWSGSFKADYLPTIDRNQARKCIHRAVPPKDPQGSYGCVIYAGPNVQGGADNCAWVLAWKVPGDGSPNKIYVKTGLLSQYPKDGVNWDVIKTNLDNSGNESEDRDAVSGAEATALIDISGNVAVASALFNVSL